ncbi:MAG TPA: hypothetical protein VF134_01085 [Candidatus Dormibacteraeota bacterium]
MEPLSTAIYEFALAPLGFLHGYVARAATTLACAVLMVAALRPFVDRRLALIPLITSAPVAGLIAIPHVMSVISLAGISLAAVAASRGRWWLLGFGLFVATMRPPNALPVVVAALIFAARARGALPRVIGGAALPALVLAVPAFLVDPGWIGDYLDNDRATMLAGLPLLVRQAGGTPGLIALAIVPAVVTAAIALRGGGQRDVFAAGAALGVLGSKLSGLYSGIFVLPALGATGRDPKLGLAPWVASAATWVVVISTSTSVLRGAEFPAQLVGLVYLLVVACFPLAIRGGAGPGKDASTGGPVYVPVDY